MLSNGQIVLEQGIIINMDSEYCIDLIQDEIKKKPNVYQDIPLSLHVTKPSKSNQNFIFSFNSLNYFHPFGIINKSTNKLHRDSSIIFNIEIHYSNDKFETYDSIYCEDIKSLKGIYWFKVFYVHQSGVFRMIVSSKSDKLNLIPLTFIIVALEPGEKYKPIDFDINPVVVNNNNNVEGNDDQSTNTADSRIKTTLDATDDIPLSPIVKRQKTNQSDEIKRRNKLETLPFPNNNDLISLYRLNRPGDSKVISGPEISITLPSNLVLALKDDNCNVLITKLRNSDTDNDIDESNHIDYIHKNDIHPTVNEIIYYVDNNFVIKEEHHEVVKLLYQLFEYLLPNYLLYKYEKSILSDYINNIKTNQSLYGDNFNAIYLLRLFVLIVTSVDKENLNLPNVTARAFKTNANAFKTVIEIFINQLDEYSHLLF